MIMQACDDCLRRTWLLGRLSGYLEYEQKRVADVLSVDDESLIDLWHQLAQKRDWRDEVRRAYAVFGPSEGRAARADAQRAGLELICACDDEYPERLRRLLGPPAVLHVAGGLRRFLDLCERDPVAIVGTRRATGYGTDVARLLGRGLSVSGVSVISGMAFGIDAAAHRGALDGGGHTIAVLPGSASRPYPKANAHLHSQILCHGVAVSEFGPGTSVRNWMFSARNRIIAALSELTVVVQGGTGSGALNTARLARQVGSRVGAVPGSVLASQSEGPHDLLRDGGLLVRNPQDVLDAVCGLGVRAAVDPVVAALSDEQRVVLEAIRSGTDTMAELSRTGVADGRLLTVLAGLELAGCLRRAAGGRYVDIA